MSRKIFLSYTNTDRKYANKIQNWLSQLQYNNENIKLTSIYDSGVRNRSGRIIKHQFEQKLQEADFIIILIGDHNQNHPWLYNSQLITFPKKAYYFMRIPYTKAPLPTSMAHFKQIAYNPNALDKLYRLLPNTINNKETSNGGNNTNKKITPPSV